jgi:hypothetical protein
LLGEETAELSVHVETNMRKGVNMNYSWRKTLEKGQKAIGFLEVYISVIEGRNVAAIVNYLPQFPDSNYQKDAHITLLFEGQRTDITDGFFHWMYDDICDIVKSNEKMKYQESAKSLSYLLTQTFLVDKIPDFEYLTHGDYGFTE